MCQYRLVTFDELELVTTSNVDGTRLTFVELMSDFLAVGPIKSLREEKYRFALFLSMISIDLYIYIYKWCIADLGDKLFYLDK